MGDLDSLKIVVDNYDKKDTKVRLESNNRVKPLLQYIDNLEEKFMEYQIKPILITLNHNPHNILQAEAWESIERDRVSLMNVLLEEETIVYSLSTVEIHSGSTKVLSKNSREELELKIQKGINTMKGMSNTRRKQHNSGTKKSINKTRTKTIDSIIRDGKEVLEATNGKDVGVLHSSMVAKFKERSINKDWVSKSTENKIRLVLALYEVIGSPIYMLKVWYALFRASTSGKNIDKSHMKALEKYRFLPDNILTLEGYPHIHIAIGVISEDGEYLSPSKIYSKLSGLCVMEDIRVDGKKSRNKYLGSISYVLKNERYKGVKDILGNDITKGRSIVRGYVRLDGLVEPLKGLSMKKLKSGKEKKLVEMELRYVKTKIEAMATDTSYEKLVSYIISKMKEGNYVICEGNIYQKRKGSRMSYGEYVSLDDFYDSITNNSKHQRVANKNRGGILSRMRSKGQNIEDITETTGIKLLFPKIELDTVNVWIECKDFFYSTLTGLIVLNNDKYYCYHYCDWLSLDELAARISVHTANGIWTKILLNSKLDLLDTCSEMYRLVVLPQIPKGGVWHGSGSSNSGKSSLLKPFINIFPPHQVGTIKSNIGRFDLFSVKDMAIIQLEEINPYKLEREDGLKLLGREPVKVERKHGNSERTIVKGRQIYTSNADIEDRLSEGFGKTLQEIKAFDNRIVNIKFDTIREVLVEASTEIINETSLTVIMCGYYYYNKKYHGGEEEDLFKVLKISKNISDMKDKIKEEIEYYEGYYKGTTEIPKSQQEYKDWIKDNRTNILD